MDNILTDEQIESMARIYECHSHGQFKNYTRAIEQAVLQSPEIRPILSTQEVLVEALEESNSLLVALAHEPRPWKEIEEQIVMNREAVVAAMGNQDDS